MYLCVFLNATPFKNATNDLYSSMGYFQLMSYTSYVLYMTTAFYNALRSLKADDTFMIKIQE